MENFTPVSAIIGGILIGLAVTLLLLFNGRMAGVSGIMNGIFYSPKTEMQWRTVFLSGLMIGAFLFQKISSPDLVILRTGYPLWLLATGGFLVGIGTRLGSGCTSGHGICGIANLAMRSIVATLIFMTSGIITVYVIRHVLGLIG